MVTIKEKNKEGQKEWRRVGEKKNSVRERRRENRGRKIAGRGWRVSDDERVKETETREGREKMCWWEQKEREGMYVRWR